MTDQETPKVLKLLAEGVDQIDKPADPTTPPDLGLEALTLLVCTNKVKSLEEKTKKELTELRERQNQVKYLHQLNGQDELLDSLTKAQEMGIDVDLTKKTYTREERDRLIENVRMSCDDLNTQNEMQLQTISRLTNERYEVYQMARSILKPLHEDKISKARAAGGR
jgi:vacuolar-type H+-ATPase subunit H